MPKMAQKITLPSNKTAMSGILISQVQTAPVTAPVPKTQGALKKFEAIPGAKLYYILIDTDADVANYANREP